jgi:tetratricopeptide (TPR) repeat protein
MSLTKKAVSLGTIWTLILAGSVLLGVHATFGAQAEKPAAKPAAPVEAPFAEKDLIKFIKHNKKHLENVAKEVQTRGTDFEFTPDIVKSLTKAGATEQLITYMKQFSPSARAARKSGGALVVTSPEEMAAYNELIGTVKKNDPDAVIKAADDFTAKYPKSSLLTNAYAFEASAYRQKNDAVNVVKYGEKSLDLDPKNLMTLLMISNILPQPVMMNNISDAEKEKRLAKAEEYAKKALDEIDQLTKEPNETDAAYQKRKNEIAGQAYSSLGMVHLERSEMSLVGLDQGELAKAESSYKSAIAKSDPPEATDYYRLGEVYRGENRLDDAIAAFTKAGQLGGPAIAQFANKQIEALKQAKSSQPKAAAQP